MAHRDLEAVAVAILVWSSASCAPRRCERGSADREELRTACELTRDDAVQIAEGVGDYRISKTCAEAIGDAFCFDWESFGDQPIGFSLAEEPADIAVTAFALLIADAGVGTCGSVAAFAPRLYGLAPAGGRLEPGPRPCRDLNELVFEFLSDAVTSVSYNPEAVWGAMYNNGAVVFGQVAAPFPDDLIRVGSTGMELEASTALVHESAHDLYPGHIPCPGVREFGCDATWEGAYGAGAWWLGTWLNANGASLSSYACKRGVDRLDSIGCSGILDPGVWGPCDIYGLESMCEEEE